MIVSPNVPSILVGAVALACLLAASPASAQCRYEVTVVRTPDCGPFSSNTIALGLNECGDVVGYRRCVATDQPFVWTRDGGAQILPSLPGFTGGRAMDINDAGQIVGRVGDGRARACLWEGGQAIDLGVPPEGNFSEAYAINNVGQIVGEWGHNVTGPSYASFLWEHGTIIDLPMPRGPNSGAKVINEGGEIAGWMGEIFFTDAHAYIRRGEHVVDLGVIPGGYTGYARRMNNRGDVVGRGYIEDPSQPTGWVRRACLWPARGRPITLPTPPGYRDSDAYDINDAGQVVGTVEIGGPGLPLLWQNGHVYDLNDLVIENVDPRIDSARAINNAGQIVGVVFGPTSVLLTPILDTLGDTTLDCHVDVMDLLTVLSSWGPCAECRADINGDGTVDEEDLALVLDNWS